MKLSNTKETQFCTSKLPDGVEGEVKVGLFVFYMKLSFIKCRFFALHLS